MASQPTQHLDLFFRAAMSIDLTIFAIHAQRLKVMLIYRKEAPFQASLSLPGKLIYPNEETLQAAQTLAQQLVGVPNVYCRQIKAFTDLSRHPLGRVITISHLVLVNYDDVNFQPSAFADKIEWVSPEELPELPFDHRQIINSGFETVQDTIRQYPLVFELVPEHFTLADMREAYEAILGEKLDKRNFSKKVQKSPFIEALEGEESKRSSRGRKALLYRFRKEAYRKRGGQRLDFKF